MKSGGNHLPLANINLRGKLYGKMWTCGCCGYPTNLKKIKSLEYRKPKGSKLNNLMGE